MPRLLKWIRILLWIATSVVMFLYHIGTERNRLGASTALVGVGCASLLFSLILSIPVMIWGSFFYYVLAWVIESDPAKKLTLRHKTQGYALWSAILGVGFVIGFIMAGPWDKPWAALTAALLLAVPIRGLLAFLVWLVKKPYRVGQRIYRWLS